MRRCRSKWRTPLGSTRQTPFGFEQAQKDALAAAKEQASLYDTFLQNLKEGNNEMEE